MRGLTGNKIQPGRKYENEHLTALCMTKSSAHVVRATFEKVKSAEPCFGLVKLGCTVCLVDQCWIAE